MPIKDSKQWISISKSTLTNRSIFHLSSPSLHLTDGVGEIAAILWMKLLICDRFGEICSHTTFWFDIIINKKLIYWNIISHINMKVWLLIYFFIKFLKELMKFRPKTILSNFIKKTNNYNYWLFLHKIYWLS